MPVGLRRLWRHRCGQRKRIRRPLSLDRNHAFRARRAGGLELCGPPVFADTSDLDYRKMLSTIRDAAERLARQKRFDTPDFRPSPYYVRQMHRYGILPMGIPGSTQ